MISKGFRRSVGVFGSLEGASGVAKILKVGRSAGVALVLGAGFPLVSWAQAQTALPAGTAAPAAPQSPVSGFASLVPMLLFFGIFYVLVLMPQRKRQKEQETMIKALKSGDSVLTSSGFIGRISQVEDHWVLLELADNVRVKLIKSQVTKVLAADGAIPQTV